jgi:DNA mismatch repair protein MutS2
MAERERLELHSEYHSRKEKLEADVKRRLEEQLKAFKIEADLILRNIRGEMERNRLRRTAEKRFEHSQTRIYKAILGESRSSSGSAPSLSERELHAGDRVRILSLEQEGIVERADAPRVEVSISGKRWRIDRSDLERIAHENMPKHVSGSRKIAEGVVLETEPDQEIPHELNLIGCTSDEAIDRADKFLDQAVLAGRQSVRLIHGYGKGILRHALAEFLEGHPHVSKLRAGNPNEGGQAVTIVELNRN